MRNRDLACFGRRDTGGNAALGQGIPEGFAVVGAVGNGDGPLVSVGCSSWMRANCSSVSQNRSLPSSDMDKSLQRINALQKVRESFIHSEDNPFYGS